jgi:hypothetical protein
LFLKEPALILKNRWLLSARFVKGGGEECPSGNIAEMSAVRVKRGARHLRGGTSRTGGRTIPLTGYIQRGIVFDGGADLL